MDDPETKTPPDSKIHLPWESINPEESDPGLPVRAQAENATATLVAASEPRNQSGTGVPPVLLPHEHGRDVRATEQESDSEIVPAALRIDEPTGSPVRGGGWTLPLVCAGLALIACCLIIPQADSNRRLAYEKRMLEMDLESIQKQVTVNDEFLQRVGDDPTLAERLAQRQMKVVRAGSRVVRLGDDRLKGEMSPFQLVNVPPPPPLPSYKPVGGILANLCYQARSRLYLTGMALFMIAAGLVLGLGESRRQEPEPELSRRLRIEDRR